MPAFRQTQSLSVFGWHSPVSSIAGNVAQEMKDIVALGEILHVKPDLKSIHAVGAKTGATMVEATLLQLVKSKQKWNKAEMKKRVQAAWDNVASYSKTFETSVRALLHPTLISESYSLVSRS